MAQAAAGPRQRERLGWAPGPAGFAGTTDAGTDDLTIETSTDGVDYTLISTEQLTDVDTEYTVDLGNNLDGEQTIFVRLGFTGTLTDGSNIDNLAVSANLPSVAAVPVFSHGLTPVLLAFVLAALGARRMPTQRIGSA